MECRTQASKRDACEGRSFTPNHPPPNLTPFFHLTPFLPPSTLVAWSVYDGSAYLDSTTKNPESTCMARFSNEESVPQPCLRRLMCRWVFEHNFVLRNFGRIGFEWCEKNRKPIMQSAFFFSTLGWVFSIWAACAFSSKNATVKSTYWGHGSVDNGSAEYYVGLEEVVINAADDSARLWRQGNDGACLEDLRFNAASLGGALVSAAQGAIAQCQPCQENVLGIQRLVIVACITQVFQMTTDLQRSTRWAHKKDGVIS